MLLHPKYHIPNNILLRRLCRTMLMYCMMSNLNQLHKYFQSMYIQLSKLCICMHWKLSSKCMLCIQQVVINTCYQITHNQNCKQWSCMYPKKSKRNNHQQQFHMAYKIDLSKSIHLCIRMIILLSKLRFILLSCILSKYLRQQLVEYIFMQCLVELNWVCKHILHLVRHNMRTIHSIVGIHINM